MKWASDTQAIDASSPTSSGRAYSRSMASRARSMRRCSSSTERLTGPVCSTRSRQRYGHPVPGDAYEVTTERLLLRRWHADDLDDLCAVFAKPEMWWYPDQRGRTADETRAFLDRRLELWDD